MCINGCLKYVDVLSFKNILVLQTMQRLKRFHRIRRFTLISMAVLLCTSIAVLSTSCLSKSNSDVETANSSTNNKNGNIEDANLFVNISTSSANTNSGSINKPVRTKAQSKPTRIAHWTPYVNHVFGFSIKIPANLTTDTFPHPAIQQHGVTINLSGSSEDDESSAVITAEANYNALMWESLDEAVNQEIEWISKDVTEFVVLRRESASLGKLPATLITIRYKERGSGGIFIKDKVTALRTVKGQDGFYVVYTVQLITPELRYEEDKQVFTQIVQSWKARRLTE